MSEATYQEGGAMDKPFPSGNLPEAEGERIEGAKSAPNPRDAIIQRMSELADQARIDAESAESEGLASIQPMHPEQRPVQTREDPLADFIVMKDGKPFMRTKVDGKEELVAMDRVRATIQKNEAAEARLQKASEWQKTLTEREAFIAERERALAQRATQPLPPTPRAVDADDPDLLKEVQSVVSDLFDGKEKDAAAKLVQVLTKSRTPVTVQTPIDTKALIREVATEVQKSTEQNNYKKDLESGFAQFKRDFPELMADELLFAAVDKVTERLETEHPDWTPSQIMKEAGTVVRDRFNTASVQPQRQNNPAQDRLDAKRNLVPMPTAREGTPPRSEPEQEMTPAQELAELRRARGQPV